MRKDLEDKFIDFIAEFIADTLVLGTIILIIFLISLLILKIGNSLFCG